MGSTETASHMPWKRLNDAAADGRMGASSLAEPALPCAEAQLCYLSLCYLRIYSATTTTPQLVELSLEPAEH